MGVRIRIGIAALVKSNRGSVELPEEVNLYCPQCGTSAADKGQCLLDFRNVVNEYNEPVVRVLVNCRICGCDDREPSIFPKRK